MILSLSVRNHGPFLEESVLLMEASGCSEHPYNRMGTASVRNGVLTSAAMFGPSGSGRSSFMSAATALRDLVLGIFPRGYPFYNPFLSSGDPTVICLRAAVGRNRYEYSVSFDADSVVSETLYSFPSGRRNIVFDRRTGKGTDDGILSCLPPSVTYLKAAADAGSEECSDIVSEMSSYDFMSQQDDPEETVERYLDADPGLAPRIGALMERLDTGVDGLMIAGPRAGMVLTHPLTGGGGKAFVFSEEAYGLRKTVCLLAAALIVLDEGGVLFVDSLGNGMHPEVTRCVIEMFSEPDNVKGAQLIASTDDLALMDIKNLFRRDQIWFADIDRREGLAELYCLFDFKCVRKDSDVREMYLSGRLGAVPEVGRRGRLPPV